MRMGKGKVIDKGKLERMSRLPIFSKKHDRMISSEPKTPRRGGWQLWLPELCGVGVLAGLLVYFLRVSWRKWPDPIIDSGAQWYAAWRITLAESITHEVPWNYGPLSAYVNGALFKV